MIQKFRLIAKALSFQVPPNPKVGFDGLVVSCEVLELEPPHRLVFSWTAAGLVDTRVSFTLKPDGVGTRVALEHSGFDTSQPWGEQAFSGAEYGWAKMLKQLSGLLKGQVNRISPTQDGNSSS